MHGHICVLKKRVDPSLGVMRCSLSKEEICFCQGVVSPLVINSCPEKEETYADGDMLFLDDPRGLTLRRNWKKDELDKYLNRVEYCGNAM